MHRFGSAVGQIVIALSVLASFESRPLSGQVAATPVPDVAHRWDLSHRNAHFSLPGRLQEISGLAFSPEGHLFAHGDENGVVYRIDPATGEVDRGFSLGQRPVKGDFEGIVVAGKRFFLVTSRGLLYEFRETVAGASTPYRVTNTGLGDHCEIEGLAYDSRTESLLFACKTLAPPARQIRIHRLPLDPDRPTPAPLVVPFTELAPFRLAGGIHPSGLEVDPETGALIVVAARERALVFLDRRGHVLAAVPLSSDHHRQPEGVAVGPHGSLYISDEGAGHHAKLTVYAPLPPNP
jgi:uncharacterized protein YjiK